MMEKEVGEGGRMNNLVVFMGGRQGGEGES